MPTYRVTDPNTGRTVRLTGTTPPSEQELEQVFANVQPERKEPGFLSKFGKALVDPLLEYGSMVGEGLAQSGRVLTDPGYRRIVQKTNAGLRLTPEEARNVLGRKETYLMKPEEIQKFRTLGGGLLEGSKRTAGAMAYAVPSSFGGPAAFRAAHPILSSGLRTGVIGALSGYGRSEEGQELPSTALGFGIGVPLGMGTAYAGQKLQEPAARLAQRAKETFQAKVAKPVSDTAAKVYSNIFQISKRKATRDLNPLETSKELMDLNFYPNDLGDFVRRAGGVTGRNGILTDMVDDAVRANPTQVPVGTVTDIAKQQMQGKIGFDSAVQNKVLSDIGMATPTGQSIGHVSAQQALQMERALQGQAAAYKRAWLQSGNPEHKVYYDTMNAAALELKKLLDKSFTDKAIVQAVKTPERIATLNNLVPNLGDRVAGATSISQLRYLQSPFVEGMKLVSQTNDQLARIFQQTGIRTAARLGGALFGGGAYGPMGTIAGFTMGPAVAEPLARASYEKIGVPAAVRSAQALQAASSGGLGAGIQQGAASLLRSLGGAMMSPAGTSTGVLGANAFWNALTGGQNAQR